MRFFSYPEEVFIIRFTRGGEERMMLDDGVECPFCSNVFISGSQFFHKTAHRTYRRHPSSLFFKNNKTVML